MTDIDTPAMGAAEARAAFARVREHVAAAAPDIKNLYLGRAWIALGYSSWEEALDAELDGVRIALPREARLGIVADLRGAGLSTRAIAAAVGVSHQTVGRELVQMDQLPDTVTGLDGKSRPAHVTTTTRTTEATKTEHDVDLDTGILDGGLAEEAGRAAADALAALGITEDEWLGQPGRRTA